MHKIIESYTQHMREKGLQQTTINSYLQDIKLLFFHMGKLTPENITENDLRLIEQTLRTTKKESSVTRWIVSSKKFFDFCAEQGLRTDNPMQNFKTRRPKNQKSIRPKKSAAEALLDAGGRYSFIECRNRAALALICGSQIKINELCMLTVGDFDPTRRLISVKSGKFYRLSDHAIKVLNEYLTFFIYQKTDANTLIFTNPSGQPLSRQCMWKVFKKAREKAGLDEKLSLINMRGVLRDGDGRQGFIA